MAPTAKINNLLRVCERGPSSAESGRFFWFDDMSKPTLKSTDGFGLRGWMVNELHLTGGDLVTFALVHQFSQSDAGIYTGNTAYLSAWTGWSEKTSRAHLVHLIELGLIEEVRGRKDNSPFCHYRLSADFYEKHPVKISVSPGKNFPDHPVKTSESTPKKLPGEYNSKKVNKEINDCSRGKAFTAPSVDDVREYAHSIGYDTLDVHYFIDYYTANGWTRGKSRTPIKDWKAVVRMWKSRETAETKAVETSAPGTFDQIFQR